jgi:predicted amidohydrolase YtcJ
MISSLALCALLCFQAVPDGSRTFFHGGRIYLGDDLGSVTEALLVEDGRVLAVGRKATLEAELEAEHCTRIDLQGSVAVPGFQDGHGNILRLSEDLAGLDLSAVETGRGLQSALVQRAAELSPGSWIVGHGLRLGELKGADRLNLRSLSLVVPKHPLFLRLAHEDQALVNSLALELAGLSDADNMPRLRGGRVELDEQGRATGLVENSAQGLFEKLFEASHEGDLEARLLRAQAELLARGWTCIHDMGTRPATLAALSGLRDKNLLRLRVVAYLDGSAGLSAAELSVDPGQGDSPGLLSVRGVFLDLDGALRGRAAALLVDYADAPGERGELLFSRERLEILVHECWQAGLQPAFGAVGDGANRLALDTVRTMLAIDESFGDLRPRVQFAQVVSTQDMPEFPALGIVPTLEPLRAARDEILLDARLAGARAGASRAWRELAPALGPVAFGARGSSAVPDPLQVLHAARSPRRSQTRFGEGLAGDAALMACTSGPAFAVGEEAQRGQLRPGYWADLTVLDRDPVTLPLVETLQTEVLLTLVNGKVVYRR